MKLTQFGFLILALSCVPAQNVENTTGSTVAKSNAEAPYIWGDKTFPKSIRIANDFSSKEIAAITQMGAAWDKSVSYKKNFFSFSSTTAPETVDFDEINDNTLGIYRATTWPLEQDALAVTQLFGRRENIGKENEFVSIVHADIVVNYKHKFYNTGDTVSGYHFATVILHEMGHFLGLLHYTSDRNSTIMYPSIRPGEEKIAPKAIDTSNIAAKYNISIGNGGLALAAERINYVPDNENEGEDVKILIELKESGECIHKEDGIVIQRHHVKL
jgi:hypothetical protein